MTDTQFLALTGLISAVVTALIFVVKAGIKAQEEDRKNAQAREERHVGIIEKFGHSYEEMAGSMRTMADASEKTAEALKDLAATVVKQK